MDAKAFRKIILKKIPEVKVIPRHTERGHFYEVVEKNVWDWEQRLWVNNPVYPSVTGKIQILKDESIINFKMNRALDYVFGNFKSFTDENVMEHLERAGQASADIFQDAGDVGTEIHDIRERYFKEWISSGKRPENILAFIPTGQEDIRIISALRGLEKFVKEWEYEPAVTELYVYSHKLKVAGTLDDIGTMRHRTNPLKRELVLMDIKSSNQFKDHYFFQVALYYTMFFGLTGLRPTRCFINKLDKKVGTFQIEDLKHPGKLAVYTRSMLVTNRGLDYIRSIRKDNQKVVGEKIEL